MNLLQTLAITKYELLMQWRQRAIPVLTLSLVALPIFFAFFIANELSSDSTSLFAIPTPEDKDLYAQSITASVQIFAWAAIYLILVVMAPLVMSAIVPKDRQLGVRELLDGLPITPATYLNGKLLGAWLTTFTGLVIAMLLVMISWQVILEAVYLPAILSLWLLGGGAIILLNTGLAVLLTAGQPTRKRAYAISVALAFVTLIFYTLANTSLTNINQYAWWEFLTPARAPLVQYFTFENMATLAQNLPGTPFVEPIRAWQTFLVGLAELTLLWLFARKYVQTRE